MRSTAHDFHMVCSQTSMGNTSLTALPSVTKKVENIFFCFEELVNWSNCFKNKRFKFRKIFSFWTFRRVFWNITKFLHTLCCSIFQDFGKRYWWRNAQLMRVK